MKKIIVRDQTLIPPFNEPARDLRIMNKPLWLYQRDVLSSYCREEVECDFFAEIPSFPSQLLSGEVLIYRDNLFFDGFLFEEFITAARKSGKPSQIAFPQTDLALVTHALPLQEGIHLRGDVYVADLFYYPDGTLIGQVEPQPMVVDTLPRELGYYRVPTYMANDRGELVFNIPLRAFLSIENWIHIFMANVPFGIFAHGARTEKALDKFSMMLKVLWRSLLERKQFLSSSALVQIGKNTQIDPAAIIQGPTIIGDNVTVGPGAVINASMIGHNVNIMQGAQLMLSVVGDGCYIPFRTALFMTTLMENSMVAQNACLQACVVGRDTFIGAGNTFTDFNLLAKPLKVWHKGALQEVGLPVIGGCVGHNCRIGSGHIIYPAREIESDVVLFLKEGRTIITKNISYEESDHHGYPDQHHIAKYHDHDLLQQKTMRTPTDQFVKSVTS
jgi:UDP-N-acetylglucosamine diphosphorylase / glucose-1-phosphate thymidylyltransferase / UDP-N-acetylgalactosamine diphosphorylase / glucosamine-1-phosphate N-acetyltransferase / galactosamine-1-phosphate N-acetyltransferase